MSPRDMKLTSLSQITRRCQRYAFTLIELLIVMGIIASLMAILLPALASSREEARSAICMVHLDQIFKASYVYVNEHDDYLPRFGYPPTGEQLADETAAEIRPIWWAAQINRELNGVTEIYRCPSDEDPLQDFQVVRLPGGTLAVSGGTEAG